VRLPTSMVLSSVTSSGSTVRRPGACSSLSFWSSAAEPGVRHVATTRPPSLLRSSCRTCTGSPSAWSGHLIRTQTDGPEETEGGGDAMRGRWGGLTNSRPIPRDAPCTKDTPPPEAAAENALAATASLAIAPLLTGGFGLDPSSSFSSALPSTDSHRSSMRIMQCGRIGLKRWVQCSAVGWMDREVMVAPARARARLGDSHGWMALHVFLPPPLSHTPEKLRAT
jgi:hypothetical protein